MKTQKMFTPGSLESVYLVAHLQISRPFTEVPKLFSHTRTSVGVYPRDKEKLFQGLCVRILPPFIFSQE